MEKERYALIFSVIFLLALGLIMIFSTGSVDEEELIRNRLFLKHLSWMALSIGGLLAISRIDYHFYQRHATKLLMAVFLLLIIVLIPGIGYEAHGARRWLRAGPVGFQPSEFAKFALIIFFASFLALRKDKIKGFLGTFLPVMLILGLTAGLIVKEPDLGTAGLICIVALVLFFVAGVRLIYLLGFGALAASLTYIILWPKFTYWQGRIQSFLNPWEDPQGGGYQIIQSLIALGRGGVAGVGFGASQQKLFFLPAARTDFLLAILGEEMGFLGTAFIVLLYTVFIYAGMSIARKAQDFFGFLLAFGFTVGIALQAVTNIAVVTASVPTKGLSLPFVSFGGSSLLFSMLSAGILLSISQKKEAVENMLEAVGGEDVN
jgi:cell division protein FtsW